MPIPTSIKLDPRMKEALERLAEERFTPVSSLIKQAIAKYLEGEGIVWREGSEKRPKKNRRAKE